MLCKIRELRGKPVLLCRLMTKSDRLAGFVRSRPLLLKAFEDFKLDILDQEGSRESLIVDIR